jgi:hypothetical protein
VPGSLHPMKPTTTHVIILAVIQAGDVAGRNSSARRAERLACNRRCHNCPVMELAIQIQVDELPEGLYPGDMPEGTLRAILRQAAIEPEMFLDA